MIGRTTLAWLSALCDERTLRDVIEPHVADVQDEWCAARRDGRLARAAWIRVRGLWHLLAALATLAPGSAWRALAPAPGVAIAVLAAMGAGIALIFEIDPELARRQALWAAIALGAGALGAAVPEKAWRAIALPLGVGSIAAVGSAVVFGDGRFVELGIPLAPIQIVKSVLLVAIAAALACRRRRWIAIAPAGVLAIGLVPFTAIAPVPHVERIATGGHAPLPLAMLAIGASLALVVLLGVRARAARSPITLAVAGLVALELAAHAAGRHALPLVSYGGSSLVGTALGVGIALSASRTLRAA